MKIVYKLGAPNRGVVVNVIDDPAGVRFMAGTAEIARAPNWAAALEATNRFVGRGYWIELP